MRNIQFCYLLIVFASAMSGCERRKPGNHYILSVNQSGWYVVVYNQKEAAPLIVRNGYYLINFSENRVIYTSTRFTEGSYEPRYTVIYPDGNMKEVKRLSWATVKAMDTYSYSDGGQSGLIGAVCVRDSQQECDLSSLRDVLHGESSGLEKYIDNWLK